MKFEIIITVVYLVSAIILYSIEKKSYKNEENKILYDWVETLVQCAEQTMQQATGAEKKAFVVAQLKKMGARENEWINSVIEAAVYRLK